MRTWTDRTSPTLSRLAGQEWRKIVNRTHCVALISTTTKRFRRVVVLLCIACLVKY
jgi:hypothetical protein